MVGSNLGLIVGWKKPQARVSMAKGAPINVSFRLLWPEGPC